MSAKSVGCAKHTRILSAYETSEPHSIRSPGLLGRYAQHTLHVWVASVFLAAAWVGGCQGPETAAPAPATQQGAGAVPQADEEATPATSQTPAKVVKQPRGKVSGRQPQITVEKDVCDLGEVGVDTKFTGEFKFTNTGTAPLKITQVIGCCGVDVKGVKAGQEYAPGQSGTLEFTYRAISIPYPAMKKVLYLETNDPEQKTTTLTVKAAIVRRVDFKPENLKLVLRRANAGCPEITLTSVDKRPFSITSFEATGGTITAQFDPKVKATVFVLKPNVDMAKLDSHMRGQISLDVTHPECTNVEIVYEVMEEFTINPPTIMMFELKPGQAVQRDIWILGNYDDDFEIEAVSSQKGTIRLVNREKIGNRYRLRIEIVPGPRREGSSLASDMLEVKIKGGKTLSIPFRGFYQSR
jgi:hypothetical protein